MKDGLECGRPARRRMAVVRRRNDAFNLAEHTKRREGTPPAAGTLRDLPTTAGHGARYRLLMRRLRIISNDVIPMAINSTVPGSGTVVASGTRLALETASVVVGLSGN